MNTPSQQPKHDGKQSITRPAAGPANYASLPRRLAAAAYDGIAVAALWFATTALVLGLVTRGEAVPPGNPLFMLYLTAVAMIYFAWSWHAAGQTLGMRAWGIRVATLEGEPPGIGRLAARFVAALASWACLGLGFLWALTRRDRRTWHDLATGTILVRVHANVRRR